MTRLWPWDQWQHSNRSCKTSGMKRKYHAGDAGLSFSPVPSLSQRQTIMLWTMTKHGVGDDTRCSLGADDVMTLQGVFSPVSTTLFQIMTEISLIRSHSYNICQFCVTFQDMTNNFAVKLSLSVYWRICLSWSDCHISVTIFPAIIFGSPSVPVSKLQLVFLLPLFATLIAVGLWIISFAFAA